MEDGPPVMEVQSAYGIAKDMHAFEGGTCSGSHDGGVCLPTEAFVDEHAEVKHRIRASYSWAGPVLTYRVPSQLVQTP